MERLFHIEMLIRDLIVEDQFNAKYTKNQKSIFCKKMYAKISDFLKHREEEILNRINQRYLEELQETKRKLEQYRVEYNLLHQRHLLQHHVLQRNPSIFGELILSLLNILLMLYFFHYLYQWITTTMLTDQSQKQLQIR